MLPSGANRELVAVVDDCRVQNVSALYLLDNCMVTVNFCCTISKVSPPSFYLNYFTIPTVSEVGYRDWDWSIDACLVRYWYWC